MSGSVWIGVQNDEAVLVPMDNERLFVFSGTRQLAKQACGGVVGASYEGVTPGGEEKIHERKDIRWELGVLPDLQAWRRLTVP
jgi:hypothetical protein